jgi:GMP synthase-like glutamine amidotransferase
MRIAILMTNTDESAFAQAHPKDGQKFSELIWRARPAWSCDVYSVKDGEFPETLEGIDGVMITGSPASVREGADWITTLEHLVRDIAARRIPMFGACFGHQVIATALGGTVSDNPQGWVLGSVAADLHDLGRTVTAYAAHKEQVNTLPEGADITAISDGCPIAGFAIGQHVLTTQYHPEMSGDFVAALLDEMATDTDPDVIAQARTSLTRQADTDILADWIARFFERGAP